MNDKGGPWHVNPAGVVELVAKKWAHHYLCAPSHPFEESRLRRVVAMSEEELRQAIQIAVVRVRLRNSHANNHLAPYSIFSELTRGVQ